jgi:peptidyl-dipeptidase Dcp
MEKVSLKDITIRTILRPGDIGFITYMHGDIYSREYGYGVNFESYVAAGLHEFCKQYDEKTNRIWVAEHNGGIVGSLVLVNRGASAQLRYFLLAPGYRGVGLGKKLMSMFMEFLKECGYQHAYLLTTDELPAAAHLYTSYGFKLVEEKPGGPTFEKEVKELRYELKLSS